ncbi:9821_t:CDS:2, partial [Ambispora leptoticha]
IRDKAKAKQEKKNQEYCDNCRQAIKKYKDENGHIVSGIGSVDQDGNRHKFCSKECKGITNIRLDSNSKKLVLEYGKNNSKIIEDDNLTPEQKEIKEFFQQIGKNSLSQNELREEVAKEKDKNGGTNKDKINVVAYQKYLDFLEKLNLREDFSMITTHDGLVLYATIIRPLIINKNNNKVVSYDARNHGLSGQSFTTLGQIEACDLQDIIDYVKKKYQPEKIGLYGFSMGAATLIF